jgi:biotin transport system ATP-binding protein
LISLSLDSVYLSKWTNGIEQFTIRDLNLDLNSRDFTVLTGKNGCGKSMIMRIIGGLEVPDKGSIHYTNLENGKILSPKDATIGMLLQHPRSQVLGLTVEDDLRLGNPQDALDHALTWSGLSEKRFQDPSTLSGGELARLILAGIMMTKPKFILLDEPFGHLDFPGVRMVLESIVELHTQGVGILLITHHLDQVLAHTTRIILMKEGKIVADGIPERILPFLEDHGVKRPAGKLEDMSWL